MLDTKKMLQDGFRKTQIVLVEELDRNGKKHFVAVDSIEHAKQYKGSAATRCCTLYTKEDTHGELGNI